jgi:cytochrome c
MSKFRKGLLAVAGLITLTATPAWAEGDGAAGEKVFKKCTACHAVGEGAKHKVGPQLNGVLGRTAGTAEGYKYSKAMIEAGSGGLIWSAETVSQYLHDPKGFVKGNKMAFAGLKENADVANVIAYLAGFPAAVTGAAEAPPAEAKVAESAPTAETAPEPAAADTEIPSHGVLHLGRMATEDEIAAWDIDIRPDGLGLPEGKGTVARGEELYVENCAVCHGEFGEAVDRWPVLAGGHDSLKNERPEKTIGSYWPHASTVYDYIRRAMPFGSARSLSDDDVYALTAYVLYLNDVVTDQEFELSKQNFTSITLPNAGNFIPDDRLSEPHYAKGKEPCMKDCKPSVEITAHALVLDVTPDSDGEGQGAIE